MKYDYIVVGAGLSGGIIARQLAEKYNKKVLIVEKRNHIAGNLFEYKTEDGITIQKYGPHVFHTNNEEVYNFFISFCKPINYKTKCEAVIDSISTPSPFNFKTIDQFYSSKDAQSLKNELKSFYGDRKTVTVVELLTCQSNLIKSFANMLFEKDYKPYTAKQWNVDPSEIDPSVLKRVPIVLSYGDTYFYDKYEFVPLDGFNETYERIIKHKNIEVELNTDALEHITIDYTKKQIFWDNQEARIVYTGPIDELFENVYGQLPYRSLRFDVITKNIESFQNVFIVAYPQEAGFTRITEYSKLPYTRNVVKKHKTAYAVEYPVPYDKSKGNEPYYPVLTDKSNAINIKYQELASSFYDLTICGRLADFKYYNMDQAILRALSVFEEMEKKYGSEI